MIEPAAAIARADATRSGAARPPAARAGNSIGFLRVALAAMVIYSHAHLLGGFAPEPLLGWTNGALILGGFAVQCFFVLSGFLVATSYRRLRSPWPFLWHRFLRLAPGLWGCLLVTALVLGPILFYSGAHHGGYFAQQPSPVGYVGRNMFSPRAQIDIGDLLAHNPWGGDLNGSLWTLFYEGACYGVIAIVGVLGLLERRRIAWIALVAASVLGYGWNVTGHAPAIVARLFDTPGKLLCLHFAAGAAWAVFPGAAAAIGSRHWPGIAATILLASAWHWSCGNLLSPILLPIVLLWLTDQLPIRNWEIKARGDYSYGLYVFGYPVEQVLSHFGVHHAGFMIYLAVSFVVTLLLATLSWHWLETPALRLKNLLPRRRSGVAPAPG